MARVGPYIYLRFRMREPGAHAVRLLGVAAHLIEGNGKALAQRCARFSNADLIVAEEQRTERLAHDMHWHALDAPRVPTLECRLSDAVIDKLEQGRHHDARIARIQIMRSFRKKFGGGAGKTERAIDGHHRADQIRALRGKSGCDLATH